MPTATEETTYQVTMTRVEYVHSYYFDKPNVLYSDLKPLEGRSLGQVVQDVGRSPFSYCFRIRTFLEGVILIDGEERELNVEIAQSSRYFLDGQVFMPEDILTDAGGFPIDVIKSAKEGKCIVLCRNENYELFDPDEDEVIQLHLTART